MSKCRICQRSNVSREGAFTGLDCRASAICSIAWKSIWLFHRSNEVTFCRKKCHRCDPQNGNGVRYFIDAESFGQMLSSLCSDLIVTKIDCSERLRTKSSSSGGKERVRSLTSLVSSARAMSCAPSGPIALFHRSSDVSVCTKENVNSEERRSDQHYVIGHQRLREIVRTLRSNLIQTEI